MIDITGMAPRSLRKPIVGFKTGQRLGKDLHLEGAEKEFTMVRFSKINALSKG